MATANAFLPAPPSAKMFPTGDWADHGCGIAQTRFNPGETTIGPENVSRLRLRWVFEAGSGITGTPAVIGDRVIFGSWDGRVYALDRISGKSIWTFDAGVRNYPPDRHLGIFASPAVAGRSVYIASDRLLKLDLESGKQIWERTVGNPDKTFEYFWAPPLVHGDRVYAGVSDGSEKMTRGRFICLDAVTGMPRWTFFTVAADVAGGAVFAALSLDPQAPTLYGVTGSPFSVRPGPLQHSCSVIALDAISGTLLWADQVHPHDKLNLDLNCPPMLISTARSGSRRQLIVVGGKDGLRAWDRMTKKRLWHVQLTPSLPPNGKESLPTTGPETGPTAAAYGLVFFASNNHSDKGCLVAGLEAASGEMRWVHSLPAFEFGPISVANGVVYLGLVDGKLRAWRAQNGELLWESPAAQPIVAGAAIAHGMVFIGTGAGAFLPGNKLMAFAL